MTTTPEAHAVDYGERTIAFSLVRRPRATLAIHVHPDMSVEVVAPHEASIDKISDLVKRRARWILRQVRGFEKFHPRTPERRFVAGETHRYLGRQYRIKVVHHIQADVSLSRGFITVQTHLPKRPDVTRELVQGWYKKRAREKFLERTNHCLGRFPNPDEVRPTGIIVRQLAGRWGSMTGAGRLVINRRLIEAPVPSIDYVILHELCHRIHPHHGPEFWALVETLMPGWRKWKDRLEEVMV
jgi:hypothetical protein